MDPESFAALVAERAARSDEVVRLGGHTGGWDDVLDAADSAARWLSLCGVRRGDVVAVVADASLGTAATILGAWRTGATVAVLAAPGSTKRLRTDYPDWLGLRLAQLGAKVVTGDEVPDIGWPATAPGPSGVCGAGNPAPPEPAIDPPLILQLTSGSTGDPKVVPVTAAAALANVEATATRLGVTRRDRVVSWLPLNHDMGLIGTFVLPALYGAGLRLSTPDTFVRSPMGWLTELSESRATMTFAPHFAYALVARYGNRRPPAADTDLSALRHCLNGSEPVDGAEFAAFGELAAAYGLAPDTLRPGYGMAELGLVFSAAESGSPLRTVTADPNSLVAAATVRADANGTTVVGCGHPLPGYTASVRDESGESLPDGTVGEIRVTGPSLFAGYRGRARGSHFDSDGAYRTGDLGFIDDGEIFVCGRTKDVIIVRGRNVLPQDIERCVSGIDGVRDGNVAAFGVRRNGAEAVVVVAESSMPSAQLRAGVAERVRDHVDVRPADVVLLGNGELPKTTSGKLQRQLSKDLYLEGAWHR